MAEGSLVLGRQIVNRLEQNWSYKLQIWCVIIMSHAVKWKAAIERLVSVEFSGRLYNWMILHGGCFLFRFWLYSTRYKPLFIPSLTSADWLRPVLLYGQIRNKKQIKFGSPEPRTVWLRTLGIKIILKYELFGHRLWLIGYESCRSGTGPNWFSFGANMTRSGFKSPPNGFKPYSNGSRSCLPRLGSDRLWCK